jgi:hypothetical protein
MNQNRCGITLVFWLISLMFGGCTLAGISQPTSTASSESQPEAVYTSAAQTIVAELTRVAGPSTQEPGAVQPTESTPAPSLGSPTATPPAVETPSPTETPTPVPTDTPEATGTPTLTPTGTISATDPKLNLGSPSWSDHFANGSNWYLYSDEYATFKVKDSMLVMTSISTGYRNAWMLALPEPENYYMEITAYPRACSGRDRYGVIFRTDADTGYLFGFSCDGEYSLLKWDGETSTKLVDWKASTSILAGANQTNHLGLMVRDNQFALYANGSLLTEVKDSSYQKGGFGLFIGAQNTQDFKVQVTQADYWELP